MKKTLTKVVFFALVTVAFCSLFFDNSVYASAIPREIIDELNQRCSPGAFYQYKIGEDGVLRRVDKPFDIYHGNNNHMSTNYATVKDSQGRDVLISSLQHKRDFVISDSTEITIHYVTAGCPGKPTRSSRLTNVKIVNDAESATFRDVFNVSPANAVSGWGGGIQLNDLTAGGGTYTKVGELKITLKSDYRSKLKNGRNIIGAKAAHCIASPGSGNFSAWTETHPDNRISWPCMYVDFQLSVIKLGDYQTDAQSKIKVKKSDGTVPDDWGTPGRTVNAQPGETLYFQHTIESTTGSNNTGTRPRNLIVRANDDYAKVFNDPKIKNNELQSQHFDPSKNAYNLFQLTQEVKQNTGVFFRATAEKNFTGGGTQSYQSYTVKDEDRGKTFCQWLEFNNHTSPGKPYHSTPYQTLHSNINVSVTNMACAYIPYNNDPIPPNVVAGGGNACGGNCGEVEAGTPQVPLRANMLKPDKTAKTKPIEWKLTHFVVKPNQAIPGVGISPKDENGNPLSGGFVSEYGVDPCATSIYNTAAVYNTVDTSKRIQRCQTIANGTIANLDSTKTIDIPSLGMGDPLNKFSVPESAEVGTKYCFALSISPYMMSKDWDKAKQDSFKDWYHGKPGCIIVVKKPKTQFLGGGIYAGSGVVASQSTRVTAYSRRTGPQSTSTSNVERKFGSWVEYELVVNKGTNSGLATNGIFGPTMVGTADPNQAVTGIAGRSTKDVKFQNRLTLANNDSTYGNFGGSINYAQSFFTRLKNYYQSRSSGMVQYTTRLRVVAGSEYKSNIDVNLSAISNTGGKTTVIYAPNNTVTISGNIQNTNVNVRSVGQTIIIAKNININQNVTRVDAWLLASDSIDTCKITGSLSSTVCNKHLLVNGPVVVASNKDDGLKLNRTAGSEGAGDGIGNPGETFLLGYDAYQWIVNQANVGGVRITTSYTKELPVRY